MPKRKPAKAKTTARRRQPLTTTKPLTVELELRCIVVALNQVRTAIDHVADHVQQLARVAKLELETGDTVVLRTDHILTRDQAQHISERARAELPEGVNLMVLSAGISVDVMRKVENADA